MNLISISPTKWVNADLISGMEILTMDGKPTLLIYVGKLTFVSNLEINELLGKLNSSNLTNQYWAGR